MPIKRSARKKMRSDKKRHLRNLNVMSELKSRNKKLEKLLATNNKDQASVALKEFVAKLDRAVAKGIIRKNTASRKKSRLAKSLKKCLSGAKLKPAPVAKPSPQREETPSQPSPPQE